MKAHFSAYSVSEFHVLPSLIIRDGDCGTPGCTARHFGIFLQWGCWGICLAIDF
jgi:hypothetical protein